MNIVKGYTCCTCVNVDYDALGFPGDLVVKNPPTHAKDAGDVGPTSGQENLLEKEKEQHTPVFLLKSSTDNGHGRLQSLRSQRVNYNLATEMALFQTY